MKNILVLIAIAFSFPLMFGCKKSQPSYSVSATINAVNYSLPNCYALFSGGTLDISGVPNFTKQVAYPCIALRIINWNGSPGAFTFDGTTCLGSCLLTDSLDELALYGTITITAASSNSISGTFSFSSWDQTKVTNGKFYSKLTRD
ncbi:MAG: hypothetical protein P4L41_01090 [Flavipsychrobacter sp.]|nr:hypothetical protein [Flavipsychrobacter sp.]